MTSTRSNQVSGPAIWFPEIVLIPENCFDPRNVKTIFFSKIWELILKNCFDSGEKRIPENYFLFKAAGVDEWTEKLFSETPCSWRLAHPMLPNCGHLMTIDRRGHGNVPGCLFLGAVFCFARPENICGITGNPASWGIVLRGGSHTTDPGLTNRRR